MPGQKRTITTNLGPTAQETAPHERPVGVGLLTYVLCYDDLGAGDSSVVAALGDDVTQLVIGRGSRRELRDGMLRLPDAYVARRQATLKLTAAGWELCNESQRGTWVDGRPAPSVPLRDGQLIEVGHSLLLYRCVPAGEAKEMLSPSSTVLLGPTPTLCPELRRLARDILSIAGSKIPVMLLGESGAGKELVARFVHDHSGRGAFVPVNCAAIPDDLFEATLFGHVPGAFTGAGARKGLIRSADGGTLFLDEIGEIAPHLQTKLLRVLEEQVVTPVGSDEGKRVDVRFIAATNADVYSSTSGFRQDLLMRFGSFVATLPPLRRRRDDLGILMASALKSLPNNPVMIETEAARQLFFGPLSGNIRGLVRAIQTAALLAGKDKIAISHLERALPRIAEGIAPQHGEPELPREPDGGLPSREQLATLLKQEGTVRRVALRLRVTERTVGRWMRKYGLPAPGRQGA